MNTSKIKTYAIQARRDFIKAVTERANIYGIFSDDHIEPLEFKGDMAIIGERAFPKKEGELREKLVDRVKRDGFTMVMRSCAYTWFNRFVALRYMEIHDYLEHGYRVLSNNGGSVIPEILEHAANVEFQGLDKDKVIELKLSGTKDNELYHLLILAQCNDLHKSMPFLFDRIDNETELLLPDNLLHSDSSIRKMVTEIDESDWNNVEIIGWIYQFYISERKDEVIGKVVKSEDIPAATQLFTPNWIVKYMVQNTLGRMWLATYPDSTLKDKMEYYIEPAEQDPDVQEQLDAITPKELNPEEITFLDPACGSGHILVEAYDVFKEIYLERGYRTKDIPQLIIGKNLYGLDICDRAAQLACFAILMKARADDRRILGLDDLKLNVMAIQEAKPSDKRNVEIFFKGDEYKTIRSDLNEIVSLFESGKTFGSLIAVPDHLVQRMEKIEETVDDKIGKWISQSDVQNLTALAKQAKVLAGKYDCVVTNPPYMGGNGMNIALKTYAKIQFQDSKSDIFAMFTENIISMTEKSRYIGLVMPYVWMFLSSYELFRKKLITNVTLSSLIQLEYNAFEPACVPVATFGLLRHPISQYKGTFIKLSDFRGHQNQAPKTLEAIKNPSCGWRHTASSDDFNKITGSPIAYWALNQIIGLFEKGKSIDHYVKPAVGMQTGDNNRFLRFWYEVDLSNCSLHCEDEKIAIKTKKKWFPYSKGGRYRKWYGNNDYLVNWFDNGAEIKSITPKSVIRNSKYYFKPSITWSALSSSYISLRKNNIGFLFDTKGQCIFSDNNNTLYLFMAYLNSHIAKMLLGFLSPTLDFNAGTIAKLPILYDNLNKDSIIRNAKTAETISMNDWDSLETSWDYRSHTLLKSDFISTTVKASFSKWQTHCTNQIKRLQELETENNRLFIDAYGLQNELIPDVPEDQITLARANRETDIKSLISYSIGCMMGRYSLDHPGLIYAHSGNIDFNSSVYKIFPADDDGIIPVMDQDWFPDDAANRFVDFLKVAWPPESFEENLKFVADSLKSKQNETPIETIRRYLTTSFFKDHLKTYKKRPIYWLFSSGKQKAFECLVYLHRYNESTLSRMRGTYVTPLQGNFSSRLEFLQDEKNATSTTSTKNKFQKEIDRLKKKQAELSSFDDELRHYADRKISLDLDDGVKVNYGKFGKLLAEKKAITGK